MTDENHLPAKLEPGALVPASPAELVPALIADAGEAAAWRYIDFFTANIRNPNTRRAYCGHATNSSLGATSAADRSQPSGRSTWRLI